MPISREESAVLSAGVGAFVKVDDEHAEPNVGTPVPGLGRDTKFEEEKQRRRIVDEKLERHDGRVRETRLGDVQRQAKIRRSVKRMMDVWEERKVLGSKATPKQWITRLGGEKEGEKEEEGNAGAGGADAS